MGLAYKLLPIDQIATEPANSLGVGPEWGPHRALDWTLQALRDHEAIGSGLVLVGLESPMVRNPKHVAQHPEDMVDLSMASRTRELVEDLVHADPNEKEPRARHGSAEQPN